MSYLIIRKLLFLFVITFAIFNTNKHVIAESISGQSKKFIVKKINSNELIQTKSGHIIKIPHISAPDKYWHKDRFDACYDYTTKNFLAEILLGNTIKTDKTPQTDKEVFNPESIILNSGEDLSEILIRLGMAQNKSQKIAFIEAEKIAQKNLLGIWQRCNEENKTRIMIQKKQQKKIQAPTINFTHGQNQSIVTNILGNNLIELDNREVITIKGLKTLQNQLTPAEKCFDTTSQNYLKKLLIGKNVLLQTSSFNNPEKNTIERFVFLETPGNTKLKNVADILIKNGYGLPDRKKKDDNIDTVLINSIKKQKGAWLECGASLKKIFAPTSNTAKILEKNTSTLSCPIKGNITGTKSKPIKKYHTIKSPWYQRTQAEECFETETEAVESGFVKVK